MDREKQIELETLLEELNDLLQNLYLTGRKSKNGDLEEEIKNKIKEIKPKIPKNKDQSYKVKRIAERYDDYVKEFKEFMLKVEEEEARKKMKAFQNEGFEGEEIDLDTLQKQKKLEDLKDMNFLSKELIIKQELINQKMKEDGETIDGLLIDTDETVENGNKAVKNLAEASASERKTRMLAFQAGSTAVGGLLGNVFGAVGGLFVSNRISSWINKKHQGKLDKLTKEDESIASSGKET